MIDIQALKTELNQLAPDIELAILDRSQLDDLPVLGTLLGTFSVADLLELLDLAPISWLSLPDWEQMSEVDQGSALTWLADFVHLGENISLERSFEYLDDARLTLLTPEQRCQHALRFLEIYKRYLPDAEKLMKLAHDAHRTREEAPHVES